MAEIRSLHRAVVVAAPSQRAAPNLPLLVHVELGTGIGTGLAVKGWY
jgi:hypothetical protein